MAAISSLVLGTTAAASAGIGFVQAQAEADDIKEQAAFQAGQLRLNKQVVDLQQEEAIKAGDDLARQHMNRIQQFVGAQRASFAAQGVKVDVGTPVDIADETKTIGLMEAGRIRNNAFRQAFGFEVEGIGLETQAQVVTQAARAAAKQTVIAGGINAASNLIEGFRGIQKIRSGRQQIAQQRELALRKIASDRELGLRRIEADRELAGIGTKLTKKQKETIGDVAGLAIRGII